MSQMSGTGSPLDHLPAFEDPRQSWRVLYPLSEILLPVLCASLAGMDDIVEITLWRQGTAIVGASGCPCKLDRGHWIAVRRSPNRMANWLMPASMQRPSPWTPAFWMARECSFVRRYVASHPVRQINEKRSIKLRRKRAELNLDYLAGMFQITSR